MPKILVVDDHPVVREGIGRVLTSALPQVVLGGAERAVDARDCMRKEPWDLVILDLTLGSDDGICELSWMREYYPAVPVLIVSMHSPEEFAVRTVEAGAAGYVSKDSPPQGARSRRRLRLPENPISLSPTTPHAGSGHGSPPESSRIANAGPPHDRTRADGVEDCRGAVAERETISTYRARILDKDGHARRAQS